MTIIGYDHNLIIRKLLNEYDRDVLEGMDSNTLCSILLAEAEQLGYDTSSLKGSNFPQFASKFGEITTAIASESNESLYSQFADIDPSMQNVFNIANIYYDALMEIDPSLVVDYSIYFRDVVVNSSIPDEAKSALQSTASVGAGSSMLWQVNQ